MEAPTRRKLTNYFRTLGIDLIEFSDGDDRRWRLGVQQPFGGYSFATLQELWSRWLEYAAFRIHEANKATAFLGMYEQASSESRAALEVEIDEYTRGLGSEHLSQIFKALPANTTDTLPSDWKQKIAKIMKDGDLDSFTMVIMQALQGHDAQLE